jgi:hypothetical protein
MQVLHFPLPYSVDYGHNVGIALCPHIQRASLNYHVDIAFRASTYSVDYSHNVGIAFFPNIQCASLKIHVGITFRASTCSVD